VVEIVKAARIHRIGRRLAVEDHAKKSQFWRIVPFLLVMLVMLVSGGIALAGVPTSLPAGVNASPQQATPTPTRTATNTPTATPTCLGGGGGTPGPWVTKTPYPFSVDSAALASDGTFAYSFGGFTEPAGPVHAEAYKYNISTNTWTAVMSMTTGADLEHAHQYSHRHAH
jgi:hypothetical protein